MENNNQSQPVPPQPPVQPKVPAQPTQPGAPMRSMQPMQPGQMPGGVPPKSNNKTLFLILGIIGGVLVLGGILLAVFFMFFSVSKSDYRSAYGQMSELSSANSALNMEISTLHYGLSSTETKFKNDAQAVEEAIEKVRKENEKLAELKAVKVGEGKKRYGAFNEKLGSYLKYTEDATKSLRDLYGAAKPCDGDVDTSDVAAYKAALNKCILALKEVGNTPNEDVKTYVKSLTTEYENLSSIIDKLSTITSPYGSQYDEYRSLRDQTYKVQDNIRNSYTDFRSNIEKHAKEVSVKDQADDLSEFLGEKMSR